MIFLSYIAFCFKVPYLYLRNITSVGFLAIFFPIYIYKSRQETDNSQILLEVWTCREDSLAFHFMFFNTYFNLL